MSFAAETTITVPSGATQIGQLRAADLILGAGPDLQWQQYAVKSAEGESGEFTMVFLQLANGAQIVATPDQLFLLPDGSLREAVQLRLTDRLVGAGRQSIALREIAIGMYRGDVCEIATSAESALDGHLIEANGVVVADYDLQVERQEA
jgi:hypothetical protein